MTDHLTGPASRAARAILKWSLNETAKRAGVSPNSIVLIERDQIAPPASAQRLLAAFHAHGVEVLPPPADGARRIPRG